MSTLQFAIPFPSKIAFSRPVGGQPPSGAPPEVEAQLSLDQSEATEAIQYLDWVYPEILNRKVKQKTKISLSI